MQTTFLKWLDIELSSTLTKRYALSGWDVNYDGNTYHADGTLVSVGDLKASLDLENTPFEVTLSLTDDDVLNSINDLTYRYRNANVFMGEWKEAVPAVTERLTDDVDNNVYLGDVIDTNTNVDGAASRITLWTTSNGTNRVLFLAIDASVSDGDILRLYKKDNSAFIDATIVNIRQNNSGHIIIDFEEDITTVLADPADNGGDIFKVTQVAVEAGVDTDTLVKKSGYVDTHSDPSADHTVNFTISSFVNLASQTRSDITASVAHAVKVKEGVYGDAQKNVTDTVFDTVNKDFGQVTLGAIKATSRRVQVGGAKSHSIWDDWFGADPIYQTINTPGREGTRLTNVGELYHTPVAYGKTKVNHQLVEAWNPTESSITSTYNTVTWNTSEVPANVDTNTKYLTVVAVVAQGPVDTVQLYTNHSDTIYTILTSGGADKQTTYIYANDNTNNGVIAAIDCARGVDNQTAIQNLIDTSNGTWTSTDRGLGYCVVGITFLASNLWPDGIPDFEFVVDSTKIRAVTSSIASTRTKVNGASDVIVDFLTSAQYGMNLSDSYIDTESFNDFQANAPSIYPDKLRGVVSGSGSYTKFLERMQQSSGARVYEEDGQVKIWYGSSLADSDIKVEFVDNGESESNCTASQKNPRSRAVLNECRGRYFALFDATDEPIDNLQKTVVINDTNYLADDNNIKSTTTVDLDFLTVDGDADGFVNDTDKEHIEDIVNLKLQKSRFFQEVVITTDWDTAKGLKLGDLFRVKVDRYGWTGDDRRLFIAREIVHAADGTTVITGQRHSNTIYGGIDSFTNIDIENNFPVRTNNLKNPASYDTQGSDGDAGPQGIFQLYIFQYSATQPSQTTGGTYVYSTNTLTAPSGTFTLSNIHDSEIQLWQASADYNPATDDDSITPSWSNWVRSGSAGTDGVNAINVLLSVPTIAVPSDSDGSNASVTSISSEMKLYSGQVEQTSGVAYSTTGTNPVAGVTSAINASTGVISFSGTWASATDTIEFTFRATYESMTYDINMVLTKAKKGNNGDDGTDGDNINLIFRDSESLPSTPDASETIPTGWTDNPPSSVTNKLYSSKGIQTNGTGNFTWGQPFQIEGADGSAGDPGTSTRLDIAYAETRTTTPGSVTRAGITLIFDEVSGLSGTIDGDASNEHFIIIEGNRYNMSTVLTPDKTVTTQEDVVDFFVDNFPNASDDSNSSVLFTDNYSVTKVSARSFSISGLTDTETFNSGSFRLVFRATGGGTSTSAIGGVIRYNTGDSDDVSFNGGTVFGGDLTWATSSTTLSAISPVTNPDVETFTDVTYPSGTLENGDYTPAVETDDDMFIGINNVTWTSTEPAVSTDSDSYTWAKYVGPTGDTGPKGSNTAVISAYKRSSSAVTDKPITTRTWTFSTASFNDTDLGNSWTPTIPSGTDDLYISTATVSDTDATVDVVAADWTAAQVLAESGVNGNDGDPGVRGPGQWWHRVGTSIADTYSDTQLDGFLATAVPGTQDDSPVSSDQLIVYASANASDTEYTATRAYIYDGSTWNQQLKFFDGNVLIDGTVTADQLAANSVTAAKIDVTNLQAISADLGTVTAGTIQGPVIQTASSGARIVLNSTGLQLINSSDVVVVELKI